MEHIGKGTQIATEAGYLVATGYNGRIVYCDEYTLDEDTLDRFDLTGERRLTLQEIAREMKRADGRNHLSAWNE